MKAGRKAKKPMNNIGTITENWVKASYANASNHDIWSHKNRVNLFLEFLGMTDRVFRRLQKSKRQNEFRNLKMHLICVALRLQDLSPKIRSKMLILLSKVSLDDYQLKICSLLKNSKYRDIITELPKGEFVFPELDLKLKTEPFKQEGKPFEWHRPEQPTQQPKKYPSLLKAFFIAITNQTQNYKRKHPELYPAQQQNNNETEQDDESEGDALMTLDEGDILLPPDSEEF